MSSYREVLAGCYYETPPFVCNYLDIEMDSEDEVEFSDYEIEDLFKTNITEYKGGRVDNSSKNEALDESIILPENILHL